MVLSFFYLVACSQQVVEAIDRYALVSRNNVVITNPDSLNSLSVGNGNFAFTVDITGLQSYPATYFEGIPLGTYSNFIWHTNPDYAQYDPGQVIRTFRHDGEEVPYYHDFRAEGSTERARASAVLRENPHRMHLGVIGLRMHDETGREIPVGELENTRQKLDLWTGEIRSYFEVDGMPVTVTTLCHPDFPVVAFRIISPMVTAGRMSIQVRYPAADPGWKNTRLWGNDTLHYTAAIPVQSGSNFIIEHRQDSTNYFTLIDIPESAMKRDGVHTYIFEPGDTSGQICGTIGFVQQKDEGSSLQRLSFRDLQKLSEDHWSDFWEETAAVDFSACSDPRASELERRVILSRYLAKIQCSGDLPPQETGLTFNSWHGKFHLEMHWWHAVHFAHWGQAEVLEKQMEFYREIRSEAVDLASLQGYAGVRWPKMIGPGGLTSPSMVGNYLVWQQPHYIYFAEMLYELKERSKRVLEQYADLVFETTDFMASFPVYDTTGDRYILAPPLIPAQERFDAETTLNPSFELAYWHWALQTAIAWKQRLDQPVPVEWISVLEKLSELPVADSLYLFAESAPDSYTNEKYLSDHPIVLGCVGMFPGTENVDREIISGTFDKVVELWNWDTTWGWDFPLAAMSAAALGKKEKALDLLLMEAQKNTYLQNGHNYQDERLSIYLPGNGGLLTAVARMCTRGQFPSNGKWDVKWEGLMDF